MIATNRESGFQSKYDQILIFAERQSHVERTGSRKIYQMVKNRLAEVFQRQEELQRFCDSPAYQQDCQIVQDAFYTEAAN